MKTINIVTLPLTAFYLYLIVSSAIGEISYSDSERIITYQERIPILTNSALNETMNDRFGPFTNMTAAQLWSAMPRLRNIELEPITGEVARMLQWENAIEYEVPDYKHKMPITFYGIVQDYDGNTVPNASVEFFWLSTNRENREIIWTNTSGHDGRFALSNVVGRILTVYVTKNGYDASGKDANKSFHYAPLLGGSLHVPDRARPVVFRLMRRTATADSLQKRDVSGSVYVDGTSVWYNVINGYFDRSTGHFGFSVCMLDTNMMTKPQAVYQVTVKCGLGTTAAVSQRSKFLYEAPVAGYTNSITLITTPINEYAGNAVLSFYFRMADTNYGSCRMKVSCLSSRPYANLEGIIYYNPTGSRNLTPKKEQ